MTEKWPVPDTADVEANLSRVRERIAAACARYGRKEEDVTLLAVTKTVSAERINRAVSCGVTRIGENRVQEYLQKQPLLLPVEAHLIGHLQTNKVGQIVGKVAMIQSVDSLHLAAAIQKAAEKAGIRVDILAEVNVGGEESKSGVSPEEAEEFCNELSAFPALNLRGLMTVPPISDSEVKKRQYFSRMSQLFIDIQGKIRHNSTMNILSMGMSDDYVEAIAEGSTMVRIGSAIFGKRDYSHSVSVPKL